MDAVGPGFKEAFDDNGTMISANRKDYSEARNWTMGSTYPMNLLPAGPGGCTVYDTQTLRLLLTSHIIRTIFDPAGKPAAQGPHRASKSAVTRDIPPFERPVG